MTQTIGEVFRLTASAQRDSRSGTVYLVIAGPVRGQTRVFIRDRATHNVVKMSSDIVLAVAENGIIDFTGLDTLTGV